MANKYDAPKADRFDVRNHPDHNLGDEQLKDQQDEWQAWMDKYHSDLVAKGTNMDPKTADEK